MFSIFCRTPLSLVSYFSWESLPGWLNPECYDPGRKNVRVTVRFAFAPIATWGGPFCPIRKSHTQSRIWNHAHMFTCFPFLSDSHNAWTLPGIWNLDLDNTPPI